MQDIYDQDRGLKIGLCDDDYVDYQKGNLSEDFFARRKDGSIANRVNMILYDKSDRQFTRLCKTQPHRRYFMISHQGNKTVNCTINL